MNLQELVDKVTVDQNETPYITLEDVQGVSDEMKTKDSKIDELTKENTAIKEELEKRKTEYDLLKSRIVENVLSGKNIKEQKEEPKEDEQTRRENLTFADLIKKGA